MRTLKTLCIAPAICFLPLLVSCSSAEELEGCTCTRYSCDCANDPPADVEVVVHYAALPNHLAGSPDMKIMGWHYPALQHEAADEVKVACQDKQVNTLSELRCSLGEIPYGHEVHLMVYIPDEDAKFSPACPSGDVKECTGQIIVEYTRENFRPAITLVSDTELEGGVAYRFHTGRLGI
ncbi:MAG: hypothetical protein ACOYUZ_05470 [Patescibacteria group bacterium]